MSYTASYVTAAKPNVSGVIHYCAANNATLPNNAYAELSNYSDLGCITEDGVVKSENPESNVVKDWRGVPVLVIDEGETVTFNFKMMEYMNDAVQKLLHGSGNVSGSLETGLAIDGVSGEAEENSFVIDTILKGGVLHRFVIPTGVVTAKADTTYKRSDAVVSDITITCVADSNGSNYFEYMYAGNNSSSD